ncbi:MAG: T9SS type A sorting domain-containing protein [Candidatus Delongbacteria bacterium]
MKNLLLAGLLLTLGQTALANTATPDRDAQLPAALGTFGPRTGEPVLLIRDFLPWGGDIVPFFTNAGTVVTVITSDMINTVDLSDYCLVAITAGTTGYYGEPYQGNVNAAVPLFNSYVQGGGIMLYLTGTWGGSIQMPGGVSTVTRYDAENFFVAPHYMATGMPFPSFTGNYASHDDLLNLPGNANVITTGSAGQVTAAEWALGSGAVVALTQPTECYIPGGNCYGYYTYFNQFETNAVEYARNLGSCGDPLPVDALLTPTFAVNCLGEVHSLTVLIHDDNNQPIVGRQVSVDVVSGPNVGATSGTQVTDMNGQAFFAYTSTLEGTDVIVASYLDDAGAPALSNPATKVWERCDVGADETPAGFSLAQNTPNPFNPSTTIRFTLPESGAARLLVYSLAGQLVQSLDLGVAARGENQVVIDGSNLASGVYLYTLQSEFGSQTHKMVLLK